MHIFEGKLAGEFMKRHRESKGYSQQDMTDMLGYKNVNFVSMIERGLAKIPADRIKDFASAYFIQPNIFYALILKSSYPEIWSVLEDYNSESNLSTKEETNKPFEEWWNVESVRYGLTNSEWELIKEKKRKAKAKRLQDLKEQ